MIKFLNYIKYFTFNQKKKYFLILFFSILIQLLDIVSITLIPVLVALIVSSSELNFFLFEYELIQNLINNIKIEIFIIVIIIFFLIKNILLYALLVIENNFFRDLQFDFQSKLFGNYIRKDYKFIQQKNYSTLLRNIIGAQEFSLSFQKVLRLIKEFALLIGIILLLLIQDIYTTSITAFILIIISLIFNFLVKKKYQKLGDEILKKKSKFIQHLTEAINSLKLILLYKNYDIFENDFKKKFKI